MHIERIKHEHLRKILNEIDCGEEIAEGTFELLLSEIEHSSLIVAGDLSGDEVSMLTIELDGENYALLFTDMDEFRKAVPMGESPAQDNLFSIYKLILPNHDLDGFIINIESECFIFTNEMFDLIEFMPMATSSTSETYTPAELKQIRDSMKNESLEAFVENPMNIGRYEELFAEMSNSTIMTMVLSYKDLSLGARDGIIETTSDDFEGFMYMETLGGTYVTVYTSESKMANVDTPLNKFSQLINPALIIYLILNADMDGLIINPKSDDVVLTRDVLLEYSHLIQLTCNNPKLNRGQMHMFVIEEEA